MATGALRWPRCTRIALGVPTDAGATVRRAPVKGRRGRAAPDWWPRGALLMGISCGPTGRGWRLRILERMDMQRERKLDGG